MLTRRCASTFGAIVAAITLAACSASADDEVVSSAPMDPNVRCGANSSRYRDPDGRYSFCYPQTMALRVSRHEPYPVSVELQTGSGAFSEANIIAFSIFWRAQSRFRAGSVPDRCRAEQQHFGVPTNEGAVTIAGQAVFACRAEGDTPTHGVAPMEVELADLKDGGSLRVGILRGHDRVASDPLVEGILASLRIPAE